MADDKDKEKVEETSNIKDLKGLLGWVQKEKETSQKEGKSWSWVFALIAAVIVFFTLAITAYKAWKRGREIAKLKHEIDVNEERKTQTEADAKIQKEKDKQDLLKAEELHLQDKIDKGKAEIGRLEEERKLLNNKIDKVTDWDALDKLTGGKDG